MVIRGFDDAQRKRLHVWVTKAAKNMLSQSVVDTLAPAFGNPTLPDGGGIASTRRSITLARKTNSAPMYNSNEQLEQHRRIHPENGLAHVRA